MPQGAPLLGGERRERRATGGGRCAWSWRKKESGRQGFHLTARGGRRLQDQREGGSADSEGSVLAIAIARHRPP